MAPNKLSITGKGLNFPGIHDADLLAGPSGVGSQLFNFLHQLHPAHHFSKNDMVAIEPGSGDSGDKELAAIRVRPGIGHTE